MNVCAKIVNRLHVFYAYYTALALCTCTHVLFIRESRLIKLTDAVLFYGQNNIHSSTEDPVAASYNSITISPQRFSLSSTAYSVHILN